MAPTLQARALAIRKPNNIVYSRLSNPRSNVISDKWKHDTSQDWEYLAKYFNDVSEDLIADNDLSRLDIHISAPSYGNRQIQKEQASPKYQVQLDCYTNSQNPSRLKNFLLSISRSTYTRVNGVTNVLPYGAKRWRCKRPKDFTSLENQ